MVDIQLTGIGTNAPPKVYGQINFAQGSGSLGNSVYSTLILANMGGLGTATPGNLYGPDTAITLQSKQDAINLFGDGYAASIMYAAYVSINASNKVYVMPVPVATGTAASIAYTITLSGTQTAGTIRATVGFTTVDTVFGSLDSAATIATNIANNINAATSLPVHATVSTATVTLTAKSAGARGNWLRSGMQLTSGSGVLINGSTYTGRAFFTSGAGSDNAGYTTCINNLIAAGLRFYTVITEAGGDSVDATSNSIASNIASNLIDFSAQPVVGIRQRVVMGSVDTLSHTTSVSTSLNDARCEIIQCKNLDMTPGELASKWAAAKNAFETPFLTVDGVNFDNFGATAKTQNFWSVPAPLDGSAPSSTDIATAVVSGVTILKVMAGNRTKVVKSCTTQFWTGLSTQFDPRIVDSGKVTVCDYFLDDLTSLINLRYQNKFVADDPKSGVVGAGIVTPSMVKNTCNEVIDTYAAAGLIDGTKTKLGMQVTHNVNPSSRIGIQINLWTSDLLHSFVIMIAQVN